MATSWDWLKLYDLIERILVAVGVIIPAIRVRHDDQPRRALSAIEHFRVAVYELNELAARDRQPFSPTHHADRLAWRRTSRLPRRR